MSSLRQAIAAATATLAEAGIDSAATDAELLAAHVAGLGRGRLALVDDPGIGFGDRYEQAVRRRARRIPLQHITGTAAFGPVEVRVGPGVFIPRPETEAMLEWACAQKLPPRPLIVDLCTGSGAIAAAMAARFPDARVVAVDDDPAALEYAAGNVSAAVELLRADVTAAELLDNLAGTVDLMVANPPYIPLGVPLEAEVAEHDPEHALFGGVDGLEVIRPIAGHAARLLRPGGLLAVEHDDTTSAATAEIIAATGVFHDVTPRCDLTGRHRFVTARAGARR